MCSCSIDCCLIFLGTFLFLYWVFFCEAEESEEKETGFPLTKPISDQPIHGHSNKALSKRQAKIRPNSLCLYGFVFAGLCRLDGILAAACLGWKGCLNTFSFRLTRPPLRDRHPSTHPMAVLFFWPNHTLSRSLLLWPHFVESGSDDESVMLVRLPWPVLVRRSNLSISSDSPGKVNSTELL